MAAGKPLIATTMARADITTDRQWCNRQTTRLLGFEVLRKGIGQTNGKIPAYELADRTASDHHEAGRIFNKRFLPRLLQKLGREATPENIAAIRKYFNESKF